MGAAGTLHKADQLSSIAVGGQGIYHLRLCCEAIVDHKDLRRYPRFEGMLDVVDERAPFLPWAIHTRPVCCVMVETAMYWFKPRWMGLSVQVDGRVMVSVEAGRRAAATAWAGSVTTKASECWKSR